MKNRTEFIWRGKSYYLNERGERIKAAVEDVLIFIVLVVLPGLGDFY